MSRVGEQDKTAAATLAEFLGNNRLLLIIIGVGIIVGLIGLAVGNSIISNQKEKHTQIAENLYDSFIEWNQEYDEEKKEILEKSLLEEIETVLEKKSGYFDHQRALFTKAQIQQNNEEYREAAKTYLELQSQFEDSYLATLSLFNAAACLESVDEIDDALKAYGIILSDYSSEALEAPEACFNMARIYEEREDNEKAIEYYNKLVNDWSDSKWSGVAQNRLIFLEMD